jgi:hypothetical protein
MIENGVIFRYRRGKETQVKPSPGPDLILSLELVSRLEITVALSVS